MKEDTWFWKRLKDFIQTDCKNKEEKEMILSFCDERLNKTISPEEFAKARDYFLTGQHLKSYK